MDSLKSKSLSGIFWTFSETVLNQGIQFLIQIFLARLLLPEEFGLIGMITVFIAVSNSIIDSGFTNALIREKNPTQEDYSTVFYFNLLTSVILYIILYILSPQISLFFNQPKLLNILRILAITLIINSFSIIQRTILTKKINFKVQMNINIVSSLVSGIIAVVLAFKGFGVWSLVFRTIIMQTMQSILLCIFNNWKPSLVFSIKSFNKLFSFGWKLLVSGLIDTLYNNLYYLIIGKIYSPVDLGYYTNAQKLRDVAATSISTSVQKVTYPVLSEIQDDKDELINAYRKIIKNSVYITFPIMIGLSSVARPLIMLLFGDNWISSIEYFQILCIAGMLYPLHAINLNILQVKGRSDLYLRLEIIKKVISLILIFIAIFSRLGVIALIWIMVVNSIISFFINSYYSKDIIGYSTIEQIRDILPILFMTIIMGIVTLLFGKIIPFNNLIKLIAQVSLGSVIYISLSCILKIEEFNTMLDIFKKFKI
ncbi:lipopolysaccharide biosynthesis protein [Clostridium perfringens]|uniref:lipopolysaccharide biosynthesis protein n=2 Tax=Clostridium perfringens TaxID=1502 RepID=UPI001C85D0A2|nr:lipopolysaccharide biosynthesis protein [Clostridium perfringens]MDM0524866.1 lipopolysaccharide biosynthesis protein [Clostridium perfringens]